MNASGARKEKGRINIIGNEIALLSMPRINFLFPEFRESLPIPVWFWFIIAPV